jgi:peptidoglycan glycosyltransferase
MPNKTNTFPNVFIKHSWHEYQEKRKRAAAVKKITRTTIKYLPAVPILIFAFYGIIAGLSGSACQYKKINPTSALQDNKPAQFSKKDIRAILDEKVWVNLKDESFDFDKDGVKYRVNTSLDSALQQFILKKMDRVNSRYIGFVAIEPSTGRVLSMASFDKIDMSNNPCVDSSFPAASVFKIITAAAAVEKCGFTPSAKLKYNGGKHTLYKRQLKDTVNRYTNSITFKNSFAQSVNPVFGKIGANYLGKNTLEKYAYAFGFNHQIDFEIPVSPSHVSLSDKPYQWAEIACGFNNDTTMSPVHGALLSCVILNHGKLIEPTIVDRVTDENGQVFYNGRINVANDVINANTSNVVFDLMRTTINKGTCKKAFRGYQKDRVLSKLAIGGKTGSINNKTNDVRFDWFVGFAQEKEGPGQIAIATIVAHEKYIGKRASYYARIAIKRYFSDYFDRGQSKISSDS